MPNHLARLGDGRAPAQLARAFQLGKPAMTNTLQRLEARGFIRLEPDPKDARAKRVFLTAEGRARRAQAIADAATDLTAAQRSSGIAPEPLLPALAALRAVLDRARDG